MTAPLKRLDAQPAVASARTFLRDLRQFAGRKGVYAALFLPLWLWRRAKALGGTRVPPMQLR